MNEQRWKKGDEVAVVQGDRLLSLSRVERVTPSGMVRVLGFYRPFLRSGVEQGSTSYPRTSLVAPTAAHRETVERAALWSRIRNAREEQHHLVDTATLRRVVDQLDGKAST